MAFGSVKREVVTSESLVVDLRLTPREYAALRWCVYAKLTGHAPERSSLQAAFVPVDEALGLRLAGCSGPEDAMRQVSA